MIFKFFISALFIIAGCLLAWYYIRHPKVLSVLKTIGKRFVSFIVPTDMGVHLSGLKKQTFEALNDSSTVSNLLMYSHYIEEGEGNNIFGLYTQRTGRQGFILEIQPPPFLGESTEQTLSILFSAIQTDDLVVQFVSYASSNIQEQVDSYLACHENFGKINNPEMLKGIVEERAATYLDWSKTSMLGKDGDFRIRNFYNVVSVLFPKDTPVTEIKKQWIQVKGTLSDMQPKTFRADKLLVMLHEILAPNQPITTKEVDLHRKMNSQFAKGVNISISEDDPNINIDNKVFAKVLTTEKFPKKLDIADFQAAFFDPFGRDFQIALPCRFMSSLTVHIENIKEAQKKVLDHSRSNLKNTGKIDYQKRQAYPDVQSVRDEAERTIAYVEEQGEAPYSAMWNIVIFEEDKALLESYTAMIKKRFMEINTIWELREEKFSNIALLGLLYSLPLQFYQPMKHLLRHRFDMLFKSNNAQVAPLISDFKGFGEYYNMYIGRTGQLMRIDPFKSNNNYNMVVIGPPGSGKSVFANDFLTQSLSSGWRVWMMDLGDSYENLNKEIGGQYLKFKEDSNICLNFFTHMNTKKTKILSDKIQYHGLFFDISSRKDADGKIELVHEDEFDTIVPIIGIMCGTDLRSTNNYEQEMSTEELSYKKSKSSVIESAVSLAFLRSGRNAGMKEIFEIINEIRTATKMGGHDEIAKICESIYSALFAYGEPAGKFFRYYNGAFNVNMDNWFFVLEQEELKNKGELIEVVAYGILQRIAQISFLEENRGYKKLIAFDESAPLLKSELFAHYFDDFSRRIRKYNGALMLITQYIEDFFFNKRSATIFNGASFRFLLEHDKSQIEKADSPDKMPMDEFTKELFSSVRKRDPYYSEILIQHRDLSVVARLKVTPTEYALYTTNPSDRAHRKDIETRLGLTTHDALFIFARVSSGLSETEAISLLAKRNKHVNRKHWEQKIRYAITKDTVEVHSQPVINFEGDVIFFELLMRIKDETGELYSPDNFYTIAEQIKQADMLEMKFFEKSFSLFENIEMPFSINLSASCFTSSAIIESLINRAIHYNICEKLIIEINADDINDFILPTIKKLKKLKMRIAIDKVSLKNINLHQYLLISPDFIKIDGELIQDIHSKGASEQAEIINLISEKLAIRTVAVHVSSKLIFDELKQYGIEYYQGYYVAKPALASKQVAEIVYGQKSA